MSSTGTASFAGPVEHGQFDKWFKPVPAWVDRRGGILLEEGARARASEHSCVRGRHHCARRRCLSVVGFVPTTIRECISVTSHDAFFQEKQPAAVLKHAVLAEYTRVFASMVGSRDRSLPIWMIDAYAGAGAYESPNPEQENPDGSPLVVLKMAEKMASSRDIRCVFIEHEPGIAAALRQNVAPFQASGRSVTVLEGPVESQLQAAWNLVIAAYCPPQAIPRGKTTERRRANAKGAGSPRRRRRSRS